MFSAQSLCMDCDQFGKGLVLIPLGTLNLSNGVARSDTSCLLRTMALNISLTAAQLRESLRLLI